MLFPEIKAHLVGMLFFFALRSVDMQISERKTYAQLDNIQRHS
jgi:hypothetical protein